MQRFARLYEALDASTATSDKVAALVHYFGDVGAAVGAEDAAWAVYFLAGGKPRQVVPTAVLRAAACQRAGVDDWLFEACYQAVGDLAETLAHILPMAAADPAAPAATEPAEPAQPLGLAAWMQERLLPMRGLSPAEQSQRLVAYWDELDTTGRFLLIKLIGGGFRVGVSKLLVQRALAQHSGLDARLLAQRLVGWTDARQQPSAARWQALVAPAAPAGALGAAGAIQPQGGQPYPFFLAHALAVDPQTLGPVSDWLVEWKYDGIRAQVVKREGQVWIWSRGEELVTERFPEVVALAAALPDGTVLDGELLAWHPGSEQPAPFKLLQQRINRKTVGKKLLADAPVRLLAYDLLEHQGVDVRDQPQAQRRQQLQQLLAGSALSVSPELQAPDWLQLAAQRELSRSRGVEGLMLKHRACRYGSGRTKGHTTGPTTGPTTGQGSQGGDGREGGFEGAWWKWKVQPLTADAVLVYAQAGHGRRASLYTDYTFAVWSRAPVSAEEAQAVVEAIARREPAPRADSGALQLLPFAKAYSGLTDEEFKAVDREVRAHTLEKFGPVRSVRPTLVFEIGFEAIDASPRHKSGLAVRFPRMLRIRHDKPLHEANTLPDLLALLPSR